MSRIQQILDKAERDGAFQWTRAAAEPRPARTPLSPEVSLNSVAASVAASPVVRVVRDARLDRRLLTVQATTVAAEQYRGLRTRILHRDGAGANLILVTSPASGDGKSLTVANLGLAMAQDPLRRVCVVDANLRHPSLHRLFGVPDCPGLSDVIAGRTSLDAALVALEEHRITILPGGPAPRHPPELLAALPMRHVLETLRSRFDAVLIDAPAATPLADAGILAPLVDGTIVVVRADVTPKPAIRDALAALDGGRLLGLILNDVS